MKIILFDIDGTLLLDGGAGGRAFDRAFEVLFGVHDASQGVVKAGRSDVAIVQDSAQRTLDRLLSDSELDHLSSRASTFLREDLEQRGSLRLLPGAMELCAALVSERSLRIGLQTGNLRASAEVKLRYGNLWDHFSFGGFGCDNVDRVQIVRAAIERARTTVTGSFRADDVVVIGDTAFDILAGQKNGATTIAVSTGVATQAELAMQNPTHCLAALPSAEELFHLLEK
jgi:phosphoglycolate phosphatase-like HAD superfamily hydrolase